MRIGTRSVIRTAALSVFLSAAIAAPASAATTLGETFVPAADSCLPTEVSLLQTTAAGPGVRGSGGRRDHRLEL